VGAFEKTVTVNSNAKTNTKILKIKGLIKPDPNTAAPATTTPGH
jgi:hypothetical protein